MLHIQKKVQFHNKNETYRRTIRCMTDNTNQLTLQNNTLKTSQFLGADTKWNFRFLQEWL
jgi:hypothetical protein